MPDNRRPDDTGRKTYELRDPRYLREAGRPADSDLAEELLKLIAIGVAGGIATIAGARKLGEGLQYIQTESARRAEEQRERYRQAVRQAVANEVEIEYETEAVQNDLTLTPSPLEEQPVSVDLILEGSIVKPEEIRFEGQDDAELRLEEAMKAYDTAMDEAAGVR